MRAHLSVECGLPDVPGIFKGERLPLMVILFKLFIPRELKLYYSARYQALRGHPEAMKFIDACDDVFYPKTEEEKKKQEEEIRETAESST